jgi:hypothetical protein
MLVMRKVVAVAVMFILLIGGTAYAEDGFSVSVGYGGGYTSGDINIQGDHIKGNTPVHGPNLEAKYEQGAFFSRLMFDYHFLADGKTTSSSVIPDVKYDGYAYSIEGNMGYKHAINKEVSVIPYVGFGYHEWQSNIKDTSAPFDIGFYYKTPYAVIGMLARYEKPQWSIGLDAAALITFGGEFGEYENKTYIGAKQDVGLGARVQIPLTYTLLPKKSGSIGIAAFLTPYFEYWDTKSSSSTIMFLSNDLKFTQYNYGGKAGLIFKF